MTRLVSCVVIGLLPAVLPGCASRDSAQKTDDRFKDMVDMTDSDSVKISVRDNVFSPRSIKITAGTEVTWTNDGNNVHNVQPAAGTAFAKTEIKPGESTSVTFDDPGRIPYYCSIHGTPKGGQVGGIEVVAG